MPLRQHVPATSRATTAQSKFTFSRTWTRSPPRDCDSADGHYPRYPRADPEPMAAPAGGNPQPFPVRRAGICVPQRPAAAAREQRNGQVNGTGGASSLPAGRRAHALPAVNLRRQQPEHAPVAHRLRQDGRAPSERGYTWVEFGRRLPDGRCEYFSAGAMLEGTRESPVKAHYFTTAARIGMHFSVGRPGAETMNAKQLAAALAEQAALGRPSLLHADPASHRSAVNDALYRLSDTRYAALRRTLLQLP